MSTKLIYPNGPIDLFVGSPKDLSGNVADAPILSVATNEATQRYTVGARAMDWDGSVYRYAKAGATLTNLSLAVHQTDTAAIVSIEALTAGSPAGSTTVHINQASITKNQAAGGYLVIFHATGNAKTYKVVGNTASDSSSNVDVYIAQPLHVATTTSDTYELYYSPWRGVSQANTSGTLTFLGMPQALLTSTYYGWIQTWGMTFISPQSTVGNAYIRSAYFRHDGSIDARGNVGTYVTDQRAGIVMCGSASGDGPLLMLQVAI